MGFVFTLNAVTTTRYSPPVHNMVVKADSLVSDQVLQGLKATFEKLRAGQGDEPGWHSDVVRDLVAPSMYPFVYSALRHPIIKLLAYFVLLTASL